jgi:hypothetical protein
VNEAEKPKSAYAKLIDALEAYAEATGDRVKVSIRPQRGVRDRPSVDIDMNDPKLMKQGGGSER